MNFDLYMHGNFLKARAVIVAGEARAKSLQAVAEALGGAQVFIIQQFL